MRPKNLACGLGSVAVAGLLATAAAAQQAPKRGAAPCFNLSCPVEPAAEAPTKSETRAPDKPYDWKASFAEYRVGKVPRTADGKPDLRAYGAAPSSRHASGRATNPTRRNMIHQSGPSSRTLRSKDSSTFALNPPLLHRVRKPRILTTRSGEMVFGTKCR